MPTTLFDYATVAAPVFRRGLEMGEFGGLGLARVLVLEEAGSGSRLAHILGTPAMLVKRFHQLTRHWR